MTTTVMGTTAGATALVRIASAVPAAGSSAPTLETQGISLAEVMAVFPFEDTADIIISAPGGAAASIASARVVGFVKEQETGLGPNAWGPLGAGPATGDGARGMLNEGTAIEQVTGYPILLIEEIDGLRAVDRLDVVLGAISGTIPNGVNVDLRLRRRVVGAR